MHRRGVLDIEDRAIKNFKVRGTASPDGRYRLIVTTLTGVVLEQFEGADRQEAERHLADAGYERIPSYVAFEIDQAT